MKLLIVILALLPTLLLGILIYVSGGGTRRPLGKLLVCFVGGMLAVPLVIGIYTLLHYMGIGKYENLYVVAYVWAALVEESVKFVLLYLLLWRSVCLRNRYDGVVYAVFISLGFAFLENVVYLFQNSDALLTTAYNRAMWATPAHFLFGIVMGYYFSLAKFRPLHRYYFMLLAWVLPIFVHGTYNLILLQYEQSMFFEVSYSWLWLVTFYVFVLMLWYWAWSSLKRVRIK